MNASTPCASPCAQRVDQASSGPDTCAVIVAGGSGERFGDPRGKQFVDLMGMPLVAWSLLAFDRAPSVGHLVLVCPSARLDEVCSDVLGPLDLRHEVALAPAGPTRQDSVFSGLMTVPEQYALVAIHDGARPLVEVDAIEACLSLVRDRADVDGAICASQATDTLKVVDPNGRIVSTPDRSVYWCAQTPQAFERKKIISAHEMSLLQGFAGTDDASLMEHCGGAVHVIATPRDNIKVTVPEDLALAEATLRARMGLA